MIKNNYSNFKLSVDEIQWAKKHGLLDELAATEPSKTKDGPNDPDNIKSDNDYREKWLFIKLHEISQSNLSNKEILNRIETIYADFNYPREIENFVAYMPPQDNYNPAAHSKEENEIRLISLWKKYLSERESKFLYN